jgi:hypothetical protein
VNVGSGWQGLTIAGDASTISRIPTQIAPSASGGVGDFNSDGNADIVLRDGNGALWLYPGNGSYALLPRTALDTASTWKTMTAIVPVGDFTGDGHPDLMGRKADGSLWLYTGSGGSALTSSTQIGSASEWAGMTAIQGVGDMTGDGRPDVIARDSVGTLWLYPNNGTSTSFGPRVQLGAPGAWSSFTGFLGAGDWNLDGKADLIARDANGTLQLYPGNGAGGIGAAQTLETGWQGISVISVGDFNNDGAEDVLIRDANGALFLYPGDGNGSFEPRVQLGTGWQGLTMAGEMGNLAAVG